MLKRLVCCVGPIKGGTTWLMWHLRHSPQVFFAPEKEIHYHYGKAFWPDAIGTRMRAYQLAARVTGRRNLWPDHLLGRGYRAGVAARYADRWAQGAPDDPFALRTALDQHRANMAWYRDYMSDPADDAWYERLYGGAGDKWACDFSATTCMAGPGTFASLRSRAEDVRVIYFIRNPYERLWSHARWQALITGRWDEFTTMSAAERIRFIRRYRLHRHSLMARRIDAMRGGVGSENVLVLNFDEIASAPEQLLERTADFIGIDRFPVMEDLRERHAASPPLPADTETLGSFARPFEKDIDRLVKKGFAAAGDWKNRMGDT